MKTIEMADAKAPLSDYACDADEVLVITKNGKPVAALVSVEGVDLETLTVASDAKFQSIIERSRASIGKEGGISPNEMRRRLGVKSKR